MLVSIYKNTFDSASQVTEDIMAILSGIKTGRWQDYCLPVMQEADKKKRDELKKKAPGFTASGKFSHRSSSKLTEHSNLIAIDFDGVNDINKIIEVLKKDQYTFAVYKSISHRGICCLVKIDGSKHLDAFHGLSQYYFDLLNLNIDQSCKDTSRLRYVSFDPDLYLNQNSKLFNKYLKKDQAQNDKLTESIQIVHSDERFGRVVNNIVDKQIDITGSYPQWVAIGFAIASKYGEHGKEYFIDISQFSSLYNKDICSSQYDLCCRPWNGDKRVSINTFYYHAKKNGIEVTTEEEEKQIKAAHIARDTGLSLEDAISMLENDGVLPDVQIVEQAFKQPKQDQPKNNKLDIESVKFFLKRYNIKKNELTRRYEWNGVEMTTEDFNTIYLDAKKMFEKLSNELFLTILYSHFTKTYNPIKEYFYSLQWDGTDRIEPLVESITSDTGTPIFRYTAVRSWLLGIIESIFQQTPNILQLILAGKQNTGKSVFFKQLLPEPLKRYLALSQLDSGKDDEILMCEKLIILDDEYSGKSKDDARKIKRLLSAPYFNLREPYGRQNVTMRRLASLCATTNETEILNDVTGNRRNLVLEVTGKFDFKKYNEIDKEQLFVQLYRLHLDGYTSELNQAMIDQIQEFTHGRNSEPNREFEALDHFFYEPGIWDGVSYLTNTEILAIVYSGWKMNLSQRKLGMVMKELGYPRIKQKGIYKYKIQPKMLQIG